MSAEPDLLFAYGTLGPTAGEMRAGQVWKADAVRGRMYALAAYPALVDVDDPQAGWVHGHVRAIDPQEIPDLDAYEGVADGLFARTKITTRDGRRAWVYVFASEVPQYARGPLDCWDDPRRRPIA